MPNSRLTFLPVALIFCLVSCRVDSKIKEVPRVSSATATLLESKEVKDEIDRLANVARREWLTAGQQRLHENGVMRELSGIPKREATKDIDPMIERAALIGISEHLAFGFEELSTQSANGIQTSTWNKEFILVDDISRALELAERELDLHPKVIDQTKTWLAEQAVPFWKTQTTTQWKEFSASSNTALVDPVLENVDLLSQLPEFQGTDIMALLGQSVPKDAKNRKHGWFRFLRKKEENPVPRSVVIIHKDLLTRTIDHAFGDPHWFAASHDAAWQRRTYSDREPDLPELTGPLARPIFRESGGRDFLLANIIHEACNLKIYRAEIAIIETLIARAPKHHRPPRHPKGYYSVESFALENHLYAIGNSLRENLNLLPRGKTLGPYLIAPSRELTNIAHGAPYYDNAQDHGRFQKNWRHAYPRYGKVPCGR